MRKGHVFLIPASAKVCVCVRVLYALLQSTQNCSLILLAVKLPRGILETFCTFHAGYFQFVIRFC